jgi:integrase
MDRIVTFRECAEVYLAAPTKKSGKRKGDYTIKIVNELIGRWGDLPIKKFENKKLLTTFFAELSQRNNRWTGEPVTAGWVNTYRTYCRALLTHARDEQEAIEKVPKFSNVKENERELHLSPVQCRELMRWLDELRADMVEFALCCGQRNKSIRLLRWESVSDDLSRMHISAKDAKNGIATSFPLNKDAQRILRRRKEVKRELELKYPYLIKGKPKGIEYVFVQENKWVKSIGKPFAKCSLVNNTWRRAVENAGLPRALCFIH